jgi:hypothetical protein
MPWSTFAAAFLGGGLGSVVTLLQLRSNRSRDRQQQRWLDADVLAGVRQLLTDIDPVRRGINLSPDPAVEHERSESLSKRQQLADRELLRLASGHPSESVRTAARELAVALVRATYDSEWHVRDVLAQRDPTAGLARAQQAHIDARAAVDKLDRSVDSAA